ncbi:MAG TPA: chalcone isomerase family protein [Polyangia bacterium]|nr:chalcone isomerase family protein [Polyangia bacterium]
MREVSGVNLPAVVSIAGRELQLNGMGIRKEKVFFRVYVVGLYLEEPTRDPRVAITTDEAKRIVVVMMRNVGRDAFAKAVEAAIERNSGRVMPTLRERLDRLKRALPDLKKGDVLDFTYLPGIGTLVRGQGEEMAIPGKDFAEALSSAWLGPNPVDRGLKLKLLGQ